MPQNKPDDWVDRDKALSVSIEKVLEDIGALDNLTRKGDDLQGWCPIGDTHGKKDSFGANVVKGVFNCYACKKKGNVIDLAMAYYGEPFKIAAGGLTHLAEKLEYEKSADAEMVQEPTPEASEAPVTTREQYLINRAVRDALKLLIEIMEEQYTDLQEGTCDKT